MIALIKEFIVSFPSIASLLFGSSFMIIKRRASIFNSASPSLNSYMIFPSERIWTGTEEPHCVSVMANPAPTTVNTVAVERKAGIQPHHLVIIAKAPRLLIDPTHFGASSCLNGLGSDPYVHFCVVEQKR